MNSSKNLRTKLYTFNCGYAVESVRDNTEQSPEDSQWIVTCGGKFVHNALKNRDSAVLIAARLSNGYPAVFQSE